MRQNQRRSRFISSSPPAVSLMSVAPLILVPLVLLYQGWTYDIFRHRVVAECEVAG